MNKLRWLTALLLISSVSLSHGTELGDLWLRQYGLTFMDWDLDHDGDGATARDEYCFGTNPRNTLSHPPQLAPSLGSSSFIIAWASRPGARYQVESSVTLTDWLPAGLPIAGDGNVLEAEIPGIGSQGFFRLEALTPIDTDADGLSAVEEALLGTNPLLADTDGDSLSDGNEVFVTFTNPLVADPLGGTISGTVLTDPNGDGNTSDGQPLAGVEVFLDTNFDGDFDLGEPFQTTDNNGAYSFTRLHPGVYHIRQVLAPGQLQTQPAPATSPVYNGLPDEVVEYIHAPGGNMAVPYGLAANPNAVTPQVIFPIVAQEVSPSLLLKPIGKRGLTPAAGVWSYTEVLTLPQNATVLLRFDETIIDKPGTDLVIHKLVSGADEKASLFVGYTPDAMIPVTTITETNTASTALPIDLASFGITTPVRYVRITAQDLGGVLNGFELVGAEAVNYAPNAADALAVTILGTEVKPNNNFARHFRDDPPNVFLFVEGNEYRMGQTVAVRVQATDDIAVSSLTLTANGSPVSLNGNGEGTIPLTIAGTVNLIATATDNGAHVSEQEAVVYVNNADGSSPFSPNLAGASTGDVFNMRFVTPATGSVINTNTPVIATIEGLSTPSWTLDYAPVDLIDPYNMPAADADWIHLGNGTGFLTNQIAGTFPAGTLPNGIYFLRLTATPVIGGLTSYHGQVVAKGVAPEDIQPRVTITSPTQGSTVPLTVNIQGSITSTRPLHEWYAEYAPAASVDVNNLGSNEPPWVRFASGTTTINNGSIALFDASKVADGSYIVRVVAWNDLRLGWVEPLPLEVAGGGFKPGRLRREFTDLELPVGGIPFTIKRVYDSLEVATDRGLGYGWKPALFDADVRETIARTGSGMFGATPFRDGTRVYMNTPEGKRVGFTFHPEVGVSGLLGVVYKAVFTPDPGVYEKLETPEGSNPFLTLDANGDTFVYFLGTAWNPSVYVLTTQDGARHTYDEDTGFVESRDLNGNTLVSTLQGLRHSSGSGIDFVRDSNGRITQIHAPGGITVSYGYNAAGDLITVTDNDGRVTHLGYFTNPAHYLKDVTDPLGRIGSTYEYDADGTLVAVIDEHGNRSEQTWDPAGFTGDITDRNGHVKHLVYNSRGNITQETNALGEVTHYTYNDPANPDKQTSKTDALGRTTTWTYDAHGHVTQTQLPSFLTSIATYDANGDQLTGHDFEGNVSEFTYDAQRRLTHRIAPGSPVEDYSYTPEGKLTLISSPGNSTFNAFTTNYAYDTHGMLQAVRSNTGFTLDVVQAANGDITGASLPGGRNYTFGFNASRETVSETDPLGHQRTVVTEPDGRRRITDRLGRIRRSLVASDGKVDEMTQYDGSVISTTRDDERHLTSVTDPAGNASHWQYDALNRPIRFTDANGAFMTIAYDAAGNVVEVVNRNGKRRTFTYTDDDRISHERWHDGSGAVVRDFTYNYFQGRLDYISDGTSNWAFLGSPKRPSNLFIGYAGQTTRSLAYNWGNDGDAGGCCGATEGATKPLPTSLTVTGGIQSFNYTAAYDGPHLRRLQWAPPDNFFGGSDLQFQRGSDGLLTEVRRVTGSDPGATPRTRTTFAWDALGRLIGQNHTDGAGVPLHANAQATYTRDAESRITGISRAGDTVGYTYDVMSNLTAATHTAGAAESYAYNAMGVRTSSHLLAGPSTVVTGNRQTAAGNFTFTYDAEGNRLTKTNTSSGEVTRYTYDHRNQLTLATIHPNAVDPATTTVEFGYDFMGRMMSRSINGAKTWIIYDRDMPIAEFADGANTFSAAFCYSPDRLDDFHGVWRAATGQQWFLKNHLGTVLGATDANGTLLYWNDYDAFGNPRSTVAGNTDAIRFGGRFWNEALGLYEMRARFYDPVLGRFTQEDPRGLRGGDANIYRFARNNPLILRDPSGRTAALEYIEIVLKTADYKTICKFGECVSNLWGSLTKSVVTRQAAEPGDENCGLILLDPPELPELPESWEAFGEKVIDDLRNAYLPKPLNDLYDAGKACNDYGESL